MRPDPVINLHADLAEIIDQMRAIQKKIAGDSQPASMHQLDALQDLGNQYNELVNRLQSLPVKTRSK